MYPILNNYTKTLEFEFIASAEDISKVDAHIKGCPKFIPFYLPCTLDKEDFPYKYHVLLADIDYGRKSICVRSKIAFYFWWTVCKLEELNLFLQKRVYFFLKDKINKGVDFVPPTQLVGGWVSMFNHFFVYLKDKDS